MLSRKIFPQFIVCIFLILIGLSTTSLAQTINGTIVDASTEKPLGYVNIGLLGKNIGTVSDEKGKFSLTLTNTKDSDTLRVSMVGYQTIELNVEKLKRQKEIKLSPSTEMVEEIVVWDCDDKHDKIRGNKVSSSAASIAFISEELGTEIATMIRLGKKKKTKIKEFSCWIASHPYDTLFFRLNIYSAKNGQPNENILRENIFITTSQKEGELNVDLRAYNIIVKEDVFVALEYVRPLRKLNDETLCFGGKFFGKKSFVRFTSQSRWVKTPLLDVGFKVKVCR